MKLVGRAVKEMILNSELSSHIGKRFYNVLAPQSAQYPLVVGTVKSVTPMDTKYNPMNVPGGKFRGRAIVDHMEYRVEVWSTDIEESATIASKLRKILDRHAPGQYGGIEIDSIVFLDAEETAVQGDQRDLFAWGLEFSIRVNCSTEDL